MRGTLSSTSALVAVLLLAAPAAHAEDLRNGTGTLPGSAWGSLALDLGFLSTTAAVPSAVTPSLGLPTELSGMFGELRFKTGAYLRVTRFGTEVGLEGSFALGFAGAGAIDPAKGGNWMIDLWGGVNAALFRVDAANLALKLAGGVGFDQDSVYLYAGPRLSLDPSDGLGLELAYTYHLGDTHGEDVTWKEHAFGGTIALRSLGLTVGGEYRMGKARRYTAGAPGAPGIEVFQEDQLFKGDYKAFVVSLGYSWF